MSAVIIDGATIGENSIVGASAFVKAKAEMPANHLIVGSPAKAIRTLSEQEIAWKNRGRGNTGAGGALQAVAASGGAVKEAEPERNGWNLTRTCGRNHHPEQEPSGIGASYLARSRKVPVRLNRRQHFCREFHGVTSPGLPALMLSTLLSSACAILVEDAFSCILRGGA